MFSPAQDEQWEGWPGVVVSSRLAWFGLILFGTIWREIPPPEYAPGLRLFCFFSAIDEHLCTSTMGISMIRIASILKLDKFLSMM